MTPKLKELLSSTRKMSLRVCLRLFFYCQIILQALFIQVPQLSPKSIEFYRLKQLLTDMELITSSWTNAVNQCRYVLQHAQEKSYRS